MRFYSRLLRFLRPHTWRMAGAIGSSFIAAALDGYSFALLIPFLNALFGMSPLPGTQGWVNNFLKWTIGALLDPADPMGSLRNVILIILLTVAVKNLFVWTAGTWGAELQEYVTRDLRDAVYRHLQLLPIGYFTRTRTGQLLSRVLSDTEQTRQLITQLVTQALRSGALVITYVAFLFGISWQLTLIALVVAPLLTLALQPLLRRLRKGYRTLRNDHGEMTSVLQESVSGIRLVKSYGAERYEEARFVGASHAFSDGLVRMARVALIGQPITETLGTGITVLLLWFGAQFVLVDRTLEASQFLAFLTLVMRLLQPLKQLSQLPAVAQNAFASAERLFDVLDTPTERALDRGTRAVTELHESIAFEDVSFAYDDEPVLSHVSLTARAGDVIALVGASGAGKSTLVDLIPRFYEPTEGRIVLDGVDTRDITLPSLRALMGIVSQETVIFNDTVRNNIAYGSAEHFTDEQIEAAARAANAHTFISALPNGYDTTLGERGARLSGGERQRIAIARALLVDPPILILDEATSALDTESERLVQEAIDRLLEGRTVFVIAHRLSTITNASEILVLDHGCVVERGTHRELLARRGAYFRLHAMQFRDQEPLSVV
ncbi:MAG TPA: ABC transporter transmembrane domain-containing protein [Gemmatimonadaceae bacterium]|nr:ABC transporter transmembrane domain-containing protein [Gemmatimonadaceae bacterium]